MLAHGSQLMYRPPVTQGVPANNPAFTGPFDPLRLRLALS